MHSKSDIKKVIINCKADEVIDGLFESLLNRFQNDLKNSIKGTESVFDCFHEMIIKKLQIVADHT